MTGNLTNNVAQSATLPADFYFDAAIWEQMKEAVFAKSWQYIGDEREIFNVAINTYPFFLLDKYIEEPLVLTKIEDEIRCLSNVCTHRGFIVAHHPAKHRKLTCSYHGRRFDLEGKFEFMPEFKEVEDFPRPCEHLHQLELKKWSKFLFTSLDPQIDFAEMASELEERVGFLNVDEFEFAPEYSKTYNVQSHWALYIDNYLEGFHIPFVHPTLNGMLDYGRYDTICDRHMVLQIGYSDKGTETFDIPEGHPDHGKDISAYYYWFYPNFMLNFYPWGVQLNIVRPYTPNFTKVEFLYYIKDREIWERMSGDQIGEKTQQEDEWVVEGVQKGLKSRFYTDGRFSAKRETGVHHFHCLLKDYLCK
ncbi:MAG: SRPBCC family protein [Bacteroidota bacterium]